MHKLLACALSMDVIIMDEVMNIVRLYISVFNSLMAPASKHVPCLWTMFILCKYSLDFQCI